MRTVRAVSTSSEEPSYFVAAIMTISKTEGVGSLFKGCMLNWVKLAPSAGLSFYFYEARRAAALVTPPAYLHDAFACVSRGDGPQWLRRQPSNAHPLILFLGADGKGWTRAQHRMSKAGGGVVVESQCCCVPLAGGPPVTLLGEEGVMYAVVIISAERLYASRSSGGGAVSATLTSRTLLRRCRIIMIRPLLCAAAEK